MAYRKNADRDEDKAKAYELEQVILMTSVSCLLSTFPWTRKPMSKSLYVRNS